MYDKLVTYIKLIQARPHHLMVAFAVLFFITSSVVMFSERHSVVITETASSTENKISGPILGTSKPTHIRIPKINVTADFEKPLGLTLDGEVAVPEAYDTVGYYKYGPTPGELGPAVVLGHVDSVAGPAVFYSLGQLEVGDVIDIDREDGTTATFLVTKLERHPQSGFPTEEVYGNINYAGLRLITCSGIFNKGAQRYSHNLIVFAELKEE